MLLSKLPPGTMVSTQASAWVAAGLALAIALAAAVCLRRVRGTTLAGPAVWATASALAIAAVEAGLAGRGVADDSLVASLWRYAAAVGVLCPLIGVLGAKRPQDRGWQWIVLSLWIILLVPAGQAATAPAGNRLELFAAWQLLLAGLVALGLLNYMTTSFAASAIAVAWGQWGLLAGYLYEVPVELQAERRVAALLTILAAFPVGAFCWRLTRKGGSPTSSVGRRSLNRRWSAFRDGWGAFWGLRVLQRINQTAELSRWPVRLRWWGGLEPVDRLDGTTVKHIQQTFDSLLRRFERLDG